MPHANHPRRAIRAAAIAALIGAAAIGADPAASSVAATGGLGPSPDPLVAAADTVAANLHAAAWTTTCGSRGPARTPRGECTIVTYTPAWNAEYQMTVRVAVTRGRCARAAWDSPARIVASWPIVGARCVTVDYRP